MQYIAIIQGFVCLGDLLSSSVPGGLWLAKGDQDPGEKYYFDILFIVLSQLVNETMFFQKFSQKQISVNVNFLNKRKNTCIWKL